MIHKRLISIIVLLTLSAALLSGCGGGGGRAQTPTKGQVVVYVAVPLSGFQANGGQTVLGGVRLAAEELNRSGGLLGYEVVVRPLDDESDSDVAVEQVAEIQAALARGERVIAVIGHLNSGQTLAAMELYKGMPLVVITPTASEQSLTERGYANFFRVNASDAVQAQVDARFLVEHLGARRIAVVYNNTEYGRGLAASLAAEVQRLGSVVAVQIEVEEGQLRYADEITRLQAATPDAIFYAGYEIEAPYLRAELVRAGVTLPMLASDGAFLGATIDEADGTAEGLYVSAFAPSPRAVGNQLWFESYQAVEYRNPDTYSINGYVAMQLLAQAVRKANAFDSAKVADALRSNSFETLISQLNYTPQGDVANARIWIYQVIADQFQQVEW